MDIGKTEYFRGLIGRIGDAEGPLSSLEKKVVRKYEFDGVPWEWKERGGDENREIVNLVLEAMDGVRVEWVDDFGEDDDRKDNFRLEVAKKPDLRAKDRDRLWPEMTLRLRREGFSYLEMPALLRQVEDRHNQWLDDEGWPEELRVNLVEIWSWRWQKASEIMEELRPEIEKKLGTRGGEFLDRARGVVGLVGRMFGEPIARTTSLENELWEKGLRAKLTAMVEKRQGRDYTDEKKKERLGRAMMELARWGVKEGLEEEFYELMLEKGISMMIAKSDLREEVKEVFLNREKMVREGQGDLLKVILGEGAEVKSFEKLRTELAEARRNGDIDRVSKLELEAIGRFNAVLYSEKIWRGVSAKYRLVDVLDNQTNCMARAALQYAVLGKMLGIRILGGVSRNHVFGVAALTDGRLVNIDKSWDWLYSNDGHILKFDELEGLVNYFSEDDLRGANLNYFGFRLVSDFKKLYIAYVFDWLEAFEIANGLLEGKDPIFQHNLALAYKKGGDLEKAKREFELALEKDERPLTIVKLMLLNKRLIEGGEGDRVQLLREQLDLLTKLKARYDHDDRDLPEYEKYLKNSLIKVLRNLNGQLSQMRRGGYEEEAWRLVELNLGLSKYLSIDGENWGFWRLFLKNVYTVYNNEDRRWFIEFLERCDELEIISFNQAYREKVWLIMFLFDLRGRGIEVSEEMVELIFDYLTNDDVILVANSTKSLREGIYYELNELVISLEDDIEKLANVSSNDRKKFWELLSGRLPNDWLERKELKELKSSLMRDY